MDTPKVEYAPRCRIEITPENWTQARVLGVSRGYGEPFRAVGYPNLGRRLLSGNDDYSLAIRKVNMTTPDHLCSLVSDPNFNLRHVRFVAYCVLLSSPIASASFLVLSLLNHHRWPEINPDLSNTK